MPVYYVEGFASTITMQYVEADSREEAIKKALNGDVIEGTQDTEPGGKIWPKKWMATEAEAVVVQTGWGEGKKSYRIK